VLNVIFLRDNGAAAFDYKRFEAFLGQLLGGPTSCNSGADNDGVITSLLAHGCLGLSFVSEVILQP